MRRIAILIAALGCSAGSAQAQVEARLVDDPAQPFYGWSLLSVAPPEPTTYEIHDLITIIVNENSKQESEQSLETEKDFDMSARLSAFLSASDLFDWRLENGIGDPVDLLELIAESNFEGDGEYERKDRIVDRITAEVIDVKPNGVLVLEAKRLLQVDAEKTALVLSGMCDSLAITEQGTIQSNQLANLTLSVQHDGPVGDAGSKGWLTRAIETIFPF